ncbi:MAG: hypothetical protein JWO59_1928 [Chloroflexi bacterium]|nr:hypothetical protein [Chloroflexota bacterium]
MKIDGDTDPAYVRARTALLDALDALWEHRNAIILVGAQAVYLRTGESTFAVAPYTTDADLAIDPDILQPNPKLVEALLRGGFTPDPDPAKLGIYISSRAGTTTDLLVPAGVAGKGTRRANLGVHGDRAARRAEGLEAALVDKSQVRVTALEDQDPRVRDIQVAGPTALLIAKLYKLMDRLDQQSRLDNKDAFDAYRLLTAVPTAEFATAFELLLLDQRTNDISRRAVDYLDTLFGTSNSPGSRMAGQAVGMEEDSLIVAASCEVLATDLIQVLRQ